LSSKWLPDRFNKKDPMLIVIGYQSTI